MGKEPKNKQASSEDESKPRQRRQGDSIWRIFLHRLKIALGLFTSLSLIATGAGIYFAEKLYHETTQSLPSLDSLMDYAAKGKTTIYAADLDPKTNKPIVLGQVSDLYQEFAPIQTIPKALSDATVAIEDERFYNHQGIDPRGVVRALYKNLRGERLEGASTLTQQLARNLVLKNQRREYTRKISEACLAIMIEQNFSKQQILELYLNEVSYGPKIKGVRAAAQVYFGKPLNKLTVAECALLAGIPNDPNDNELFKEKHREKALGRQKLVLRKMHEQKFIPTLEQYQAAQDEKIVVQKTPPPLSSPFKAPYFTTYVLQQLYIAYGGGEDEESMKRGREIVRQGGFKVYTTLSYEMQQKAEVALLKHVQASGEVSTGALVAVEPRTGYVRAMVGGTSFDKEQYNAAAIGGRQPGSSFKPLVYATAFMRGKLDPESVIDDYDGFHIGSYHPHNSGGGHSGPITVRHAIAHSNNVAAVRAGQIAGFSNVVDMAESMGLAFIRRYVSIERGETEKGLRQNASIALGGAYATPLEMAGAYATFANGGDFARPMVIRKVLDGAGETREVDDPQVNVGLLTTKVASEIDSCLRAVVTEGTGKEAASIPEARGKTGTTSDNKDAWFVGYTQELSTAVWVASVHYITKKNKAGADIRVSRYEQMSSYTTGGHIAAPIWADFMREAIPIQRRFKHNGALSVPEISDRKHTSTTRWMNAAPPSDPTAAQAAASVVTPAVDSSPPLEAEPGSETREETRQSRRRRFQRQRAETATAPADPNAPNAVDAMDGEKPARRRRNRATDETQDNAEKPTEKTTEKEKEKPAEEPKKPEKETPPPATETKPEEKPEKKIEKKEEKETPPPTDTN
jgi:penicillin-binding protein 1A